MSAAPFYLGDLTASQALETTIDAITNYAVDGATNYMLAAGQLAHYKEFHQISNQNEKVFWYRLAPGEALPSPAFPGLVAEASDLARLADEDPAGLDGLRVILIPSPGADLAALGCSLRDAGVTDISVRVAADAPDQLLGKALGLRDATGLPLHLSLAARPETLEEASLALGYLLERGWVASLDLAGALDQPGSGFARSLFNALELKRFGLNYVSCPTCGRCRVDLEAITEEVKSRTKDVTTPFTVAIMGCEVNGPGEARHADIGIAAGTESGLLIQDGKAVAKFREDELVDVLVERIHEIAAARGEGEGAVEG